MTPRVSPNGLTLARGIALALVGFIVLSMLVNFAARTAITWGGSRLLGTYVSLKGCSVGMLTQRLTLRHLRIEQPKGFEGEPLLEAPTASVRINLWELWHGRWHLREVVLDVDRIVLLKNREGRLNVDALKVINESSASTANAKSPAVGAGPVRLPGFRIDRLRLRIGRVIVRDAQQGDLKVYEAVIREKIFTNLSSPQQLVVVVLAHAMGPTALKGAGLSAAAALYGAGLLPAGVLGVVAAKDSASAEFTRDGAGLLERVERFMREAGKVKRVDRRRGELWASVRGCHVYVRVERLGRRRSRVTISARKLLLPKPAIAAGLLYELASRL